MKEKNDCPCQYCVDKRKRQHPYGMDGLVFLLLMALIMVGATVFVMALR